MPRSIHSTQRVLGRWSSSFKDGGKVSLVRFLSSQNHGLGNLTSSQRGDNFGSQKQVSKGARSLSFPFSWCDIGPHSRGCWFVNLVSLLSPVENFLFASFKTYNEEDNMVPIGKRLIK